MLVSWVIGLGWRGGAPLCSQLHSLVMVLLNGRHSPSCVISPSVCLKPVNALGVLNWINNSKWKPHFQNSCENGNIGLNLKPRNTSPTKHPSTEHSMERQKNHLSGNFEIFTLWVVKLRQTMDHFYADRRVKRYPCAAGVAQEIATTTTTTTTKKTKRQKTKQKQKQKQKKTIEHHWKKFIKT